MTPDRDRHRPRRQGARRRRRDVHAEHPRHPDRHDRHDDHGERQGDVQDHRAEGRRRRPGQRDRPGLDRRLRLDRRTSRSSRSPSSRRAAASSTAAAFADYHRAMPMWRCPHCGTPQAETARCWVCRRSSTACGTCRHFRRSVAAQLGYCGLDRQRRPLPGDEIRACWEGGPASRRAPAAGLPNRPRPTDLPDDDRTPVRKLEFVEVRCSRPAASATAGDGGPEAGTRPGPR